MHTLNTPLLERDLTAEDIEGDLIQPGHPLFGIVWINRERVSGEPLFAGTRVPLKILFDSLAGGQSMEEFLDDFEGVGREQAKAVLALALNALSAELPEP